MKTAITADLHFQLQPDLDKAGSPDSRLMDRLRCFKWVVDRAAEAKCDSLMVLGDIYTNRDAVPPRVLEAAVKGFRYAKRLIPNVYALPGNHDMDEGMGSSTSIASLTGIATVIRKPTVIGSYGLVPFCSSEAKYRAAVDSLSKGVKYLCSHALLREIAASGIDKKCLRPARFKRIFLGDVHKEQIIGKCVIPGAPMQQDFRDAQDGRRGFYIHDPKSNVLKFICNNKSPRFYVIRPGNQKTLPDRVGDYVRLVGDVSKKSAKALRDRGLWVEGVPERSMDAHNVRLDIKDDSREGTIRDYVLLKASTDKWVRKNMDRLIVLMSKFSKGV